MPESSQRIPIGDLGDPQGLSLMPDHCRRACGHVDVGARPHQVLACTLTLSQPGGGQIMPTIY